MNITVSWKCQRCLSLRRHVDVGMNDRRVLFVFYVIVLNLLDEGRHMYSSCKILSIVIYNFSGFSEFLLFI